jgi:hypothetical protein
MACAPTLFFVDGKPVPKFRAADGREYFVLPVHPGWIKLLRGKTRGRYRRRSKLNVSGRR